LDDRGGLNLETAADLRDGGYLTPVDDSPLLAVLTGEGDNPPSMPKDGAPLSPAELAILRAWLQADAPWADDLRVSAAKVQNFAGWSRQPVRRPPVPEPERLASVSLGPGAPEPAEWIRNPIDAFIWQGFAQRGLQPSPPADRRTLIRRLFFDLTGLPPTPEEIAEFLADHRPDAYDQWVDRLLESSRYGERWARHWLDVARYADTAGYDKDKLRPQAWPYRDYVIRSFNQDKDYRQFVEEQIAGDVLYPDTADGILGLGFLAAGPWDFIGHVEVPESKLDGLEARNLDRDEMVAATFNVFCSTTVQCARCHHHKFDPITLEQYYGLQAVFAAVDRANRPYDPDPRVAGQRADLGAALIATDHQIKELETAWEAAAGPQLPMLREQVQAWQRQRSQIQPATWPTAYGYHSQLTDNRHEAKWIEFQLPGPSSLRKIVLYPCHDEFGGIGSGFGFPPHVEVTVTTAGAESWTPVAERSAETHPGQPHQPWIFEWTEPLTDVVRIRLTARDLAWRQDHWILALAEVEIWDAAATNVAGQAQLSAMDSIEAGPRWQLQNLTDGLRPVYSADQRDMLATINAQLTGAEADIKALEQQSRTPADLIRHTTLLQQRSELQAKLEALPPVQWVFAVTTDFAAEGNFRPTQGQPRPIHVLHRGNVSQPLEPAVPGTIPLQDGDDYVFGSEATEIPEQERRARLARWITAAENPLTWRSIANRIWLWHMGRGIVDSPNDFGHMGLLPTHPTLLDWLAAEFRDRPSFKHLTRLIVTSATYRQSSLESSDENVARDGESAFYWRFQRRRLSAEEIRDAMLSVAGCLQESSGGPGYYLFELERPEHSPHYEYHKFDPSDSQTHRRSIYRFVVRSQPDPWITTMDGADCSQSVAKRDETITPMQALSLLNNPFTLAMARSMAQRLRSERPDLDGQVTRGYGLVVGREPDPAQVAMLHDYARQHGLENLCRVLLNMSEFAFVD
jgi:hypothetical protein